jgi:hypothetical protein
MLYVLYFAKINYILKNTILLQLISIFIYELIFNFSRHVLHQIKGCHFPKIFLYFTQKNIVSQQNIMFGCFIYHFQVILYAVMNLESPVLLQLKSTFTSCTLAYPTYKSRYMEVLHKCSVLLHNL